MMFNFGTKLRLKKVWEADCATFEKGDIVQVAFHDHKYGISLVHPHVRGVFEFKYSPQNASSKVEEYFEVVGAYDDRLAELERVVRDYFLSHGFKRKEDQVEGDLKWGFTIDISSQYEEKELSVKLIKSCSSCGGGIRIRRGRV